MAYNFFAFWLERRAARLRVTREYDDLQINLEKVAP